MEPKTDNLLFFSFLFCFCYHLKIFYLLLSQWNNNYTSMGYFLCDRKLPYFHWGINLFFFFIWIKASVLNHNGEENLGLHIHFLVESSVIRVCEMNGFMAEFFGSYVLVMHEVPCFTWHSHNKSPAQIHSHFLFFQNEAKMPNEHKHEHLWGIHHVHVLKYVHRPLYRYVLLVPG